MSDLTYVVFGVFLAASLPFVISILVSLSPGLSSQTAEDYFLSNRELSVGGFIASTIGYSLQVASIFLFLFWGILYGIYPLIMCVTWTVGYIVLGHLVRRGTLDDFLGLTDNDSLVRSDSPKRPNRTIHGYVGFRINQSATVTQEDTPSRLPVRIAVLAISLASVIGIAGTMMTEIDYSSTFFLQAVGMEASDSLVRVYTQLSILLFTTLYVLWGGFKAAVITDRFQVPVAYVGLGLFAVLLSFYVQTLNHGVVVVYLLDILLVIYALLLIIRLRALSKWGDPWSKTTAYLTFGSLLFITVAAIALQPWPAFGEGRDVLWQLLHPSFPSQFVLWGGVSLLVTNLLWQLIDITSLQRLQAINKKELEASRSEIANVITKTGIESGLGWTLIIVCAFIIKLVGVKDPTDLIDTLLKTPGWFPFLVPIFIVTVVVFMLSTISGFISAVAYIAHFDIATGLGLYGPSEVRTGDEIRITRLVTLVCVLLIYGGYTLLRAASQGDISTILYAVWSFQLAIAPAVLAAVFAKALLSAWVVTISTLSGLATAWYVATHPSATLFKIPIAAEAWAMLPPLAVVFVSSVVFLFLAMCAMPFRLRTN